MRTDDCHDGLSPARELTPSPRQQRWIMGAHSRDRTR